MTHPIPYHRRKAAHGCIFNNYHEPKTKKKDEIIVRVRVRIGNRTGGRRKKAR